MQFVLAGQPFVWPGLQSPPPGGQSQSCSGAAAMRASAGADAPFVCRTDIAKATKRNAVNTFRSMIEK